MSTGDLGVNFSDKWRCSVDAQWRAPIQDDAGGVTLADAPATDRRTVRTTASRLLLSELLHGAFEQAKLVALGVGEYDPTDLWTLPDIDVDRAQCQEPSQFLCGAGPIGAQVQVQAILYAFAVRHREHINSWPLATGGDGDAFSISGHFAPAKHISPEISNQAWVHSVNGDRGYTATHVSTLSGTG